MLGEQEQLGVVVVWVIRVRRIRLRLVLTFLYNFIFRLDY